jgi:hypothetical protein
MHPILLLINIFVCISTLPNKGESILQCTHMIDTYTQKLRRRRGHTIDIVLLGRGGGGGIHILQTRGGATDRWGGYYRQARGHK